MLTLFERLPAAELPFYLDLMAHLARHGIPCPAPIADLDDRYLSQPERQAGRAGDAPRGKVDRKPERRATARELGALLARMHLAARSYRRLPGESARAEMVAPRGRRRARRSSTRRAPRCSSRSCASRRSTASPTCRAARCTRTCSATTRCSTRRPHQRRHRFLLRGRRLLASTTWRSAPTTGASPTRRATAGWTSGARARCSAPIAAVRPLQRGRARRLAGDAARRRAALLALAPARQATCRGPANW